MGLTGQADVVEFQQVESGATGAVVPDLSRIGWDGRTVFILPRCTRAIIVAAEAYRNLDDSLSGILSKPGYRSQSIIGISAHEDELPEAVKSKCFAVLHRPFGFAEFRETVKKAYVSIGRQSVKTVRIPGALSLELNAAKRCVSSDGKSTQLTPNEFAFLTHLTEKRGETVSRGVLASLILDESGEAQSNETDVYICTLRKKLEDTFGTRLIFTVRGKGYMIK
jgi:DNA-binding response OmpR family regulator